QTCALPIYAGAPAPPEGMVDPSAAPGAGASPAPETAAAAAVPRLLSAPQPEYPRSALRAGLTGRVVLRIDVGTDGRPREVVVVESSRHRVLDRAAVPATVQQVISFAAPR